MVVHRNWAPTYEGSHRNEIRALLAYLLLRRHWG